MENHSSVIPAPPEPKIPRDLQRPFKLYEPTKPAAQISAGTSKKTNILGHILAATFLILLGIAGFAYDSNVQDFQNYILETAHQKDETTENSSATKQDTNQSTVSEYRQQNQMADWKLFSNSSLGISFLYPKEYLVMQSDDTKIVLGLYATPESSQIISRLTITNQPLFDAQKFDDTENREVGGQPAVSFYSVTGIDSDKHIVQTTQSPQIEFVMDVAGGGLDATFENILKSVKLATPTAENGEAAATVFKSGKNSTYSDGTFSISYPYSWTLHDSASNAFFMSQNNVQGFENIVALENTDTLLVIGSNPQTESEVGGIFTSNGEFQAFVEMYDQISIQGSRYYLWKYQHSLQDWIRQSAQKNQLGGAGIFSLGSVSKYISNKVTNERGQSFNGYDVLLKINQREYLVVIFSKKNKGVTLTPPETQKEIKAILESIIWE